MGTVLEAVVVNYTAWDTANDVGKTGDVLNHTLKLILDGSVTAPTNSPAEVDAINCPGIYKITLTAAERDHESISVSGKSSTADIIIVSTQIIPNPVRINAGEISIFGF